MSRPSTNPSDPGGTWEPPAPESLDQLLDGYRIDSHIATGGMAAVYRGVQTNMDRPVAVKLMPAGAGAEYAYAARFEREAKAMAQLTHPNIVTVFDFGKAGDFLYIVMEFVEGTDLHQMATAKTLDPNKIPSYLDGICDALEFAHGYGVIHRDIKPANIMVRPDGTVKVADFGLAKIQDPALSQMTVAGYAMGTPDYVAPESLIAGGKIDRRADIYSLGVLAYELLTGAVPRGAFEPPSARNPSVDKRLDAVVKKAMQRDPDARFQTVAEMRTALKCALSGPKLITGNTARVAPNKVTTGRVLPHRANTGRVIPGKANTGRVVPAKAASTQPASAIPIGEKKSGGMWKIALAAIGGAAVVVIGAIIAFSDSRKTPPVTSGGGKENPITPAAPIVPDDDIWKPTQNPDAETGGEKDPTVPVTTDPKTPDRPPAFEHITFPLPLPRRPNIAGKIVYFPFLTEPETPEKNLTVIPDLDGIVQIAVPTTDATQNDGFLYHPGALLVLHADGTVSAFARNNRRQGDIPPDLENVAQLATGKETSYALLTDGTVRAWGSNADERLEIPDEIQGETVQIAAGGNHAIALLRDGTVVRWGKFAAPSERIKTAVAVAASWDRSVALTADGQLHSWGQKYFKVYKIPETVTEFAITDRGSAITQSGKWIHFDDKANNLRELNPDSSPYDSIVFMDIRNSEIPGTHTFALNRKGEIVYSGNSDAVHPDFAKEASTCISLHAWRTHAIGLRIEDPNLRAKAHAERETIRFHRTSPLVAINTDPGAPQLPGHSDEPESPGVLTDPSAAFRPDPEIAGGRLAELFAAYEKAVTERVDGPADAALAQLRDLYAGGLNRAEDASAEAGDLDAVLAIQNEVKAIAAGKLIPIVEAEGTPAALTTLRQTYHAEHAKIENQRNASTIPLRQQFEAALTKLESDRTKEKDIVGALAVRDFRMKLAGPSPLPEEPAPEVSPAPVDPPTEEPAIAAETKSDPGHLRGFGQFFIGKNGDQGKAEIGIEVHKDIDDFIQTVSGQGVWGALRANGDVVGMRINKGEITKLHASGISKIFGPTTSDNIYGVAADGTFGRITAGGFQPVDWLAGKGRVVQWGNGHGHQIALTEDGKVHLSPDGAYKPDNQKRFASPPAEALTNVSFVSGTRYCAASITKDNVLFLWGPSGVSTVPLDIRGHVAQFFSRAPNPAFLTDRGELHFINTKNGEPSTVGGITRHDSPGRITHVCCNSYAHPLYRSAGRWRWMGNGERTDRAEFFDELLKNLSGDIAEVTLWFGDGGRFAIWIEPADS